MTQKSKRERQENRGKNEPEESKKTAKNNREKRKAAIT